MPIKKTNLGKSKISFSYSTPNLLNGKYLKKALPTMSFLFIGPNILLSFDSRGSLLSPNTKYSSSPSSHFVSFPETRVV